jgi:hypothetical protein
MTKAAENNFELKIAADCSFPELFDLAEDSNLKNFQLEF